VAQNITSALYKWVGGWMGWAKANFRHNGTSYCNKRAVNGLQTTLQGKAGLPITVMDDWEQPHTNATLLKPAKHFTVFLEPYRTMKSRQEK